jgi:L,D-transpeptidase YbiS
MKNNLHIEININEQSLKLFDGDELVKQYSVSTAKNGTGELMDSECTPRGAHIISEKIGAGYAPDTVFVSREPTGELYTPDLRKQFPDRDWILTRILWLSGTEPGCNQGGDVDSHDRYIYIHGSPDDVEMGKPGSRGCIRMRNADVMELFEQVEEGTPVLIAEK